MIKITLADGREIITDKIKWVGETVITASMETPEDYIKEILEDGGDVIDTVGDVLYEEWSEHEDVTLTLPATYRELSYIKVGNELIGIKKIKKIEVI